MKLATRAADEDGTLLLISRDLTRAVEAKAAPTLQAALKSWDDISPMLETEAQSLERGERGGPFDFHSLAAPLPRAPQFLDASAFLAHNHILADAWGYERRTAADRPLMYQGLSDRFYGPFQPVPFRSMDDGIDFEAEFGVIVDNVPLGTTPDRALDHVKLLVLLNDWSLRAFGPSEMKGGFGFIQAKPPSSFAPIAVTPDELGSAWHTGRLHLPVNIEWNGQRFGSPVGSEMSYGFDALIAHAALTRDLAAGTIIGSGTVSNIDASRVGSACIAERRALDAVAGVEQTSFLRFGDQVRIETLDAMGTSVFGAIDQTVISRLY
ncbi:fumarylacetoacetate hydrolase family protein [Bradyrhizobium sp. WSM3983]|uniref:fumarylacetoacetate hydrolase family protein n=1 Tax=Bradyrhizobium sp. WSM3983 TaxID=1038867 RepID=UPI00048220B5|nr:fumarylacetoacetate hydrolase family protein [Bradyrhizobium sp. WSM3983]